MPGVKNSSAGDTRDTGSIPASGRSPGGGNGNPLRCSFLENPMDRGAWWAGLQFIGLQRIRHDQSNLVQHIWIFKKLLRHNLHIVHCTTFWIFSYVSTPVFLPGESPEESGGLQFVGSQRVGCDWATKHSTAHSHRCNPPQVPRKPSQAPAPGQFPPTAKINPCSISTTIG